MNVALHIGYRIYLMPAKAAALVAEALAASTCVESEWVPGAESVYVLRESKDWSINPAPATTRIMSAETYKAKRAVAQVEYDARREREAEEALSADA